MSILCKIGLHDWKILQMESTPQLQEHVKSNLTDAFEMDIITFGYPYLSKKVCRRCERFIDEITPYIKRIEPKIKKEMELERKYGNS